MAVTGTLLLDLHVHVGFKVADMHTRVALERKIMDTFTCTPTHYQSLEHGAIALSTSKLTTLGGPEELARKRPCLSNAIAS